MCKEEQTLDETTEVADTDTREEQCGDMQNVSETDTGTDPSSNDTPSDEISDAPKTDPKPDTSATTEPPKPGSAPAVPQPDGLAEVNQRLLALQELFDRQIARNQNQKQMFDTIYREMTSYKENALLEAFHKPIIHNLIRLYDNFVEIESQLKGISATFESVGSRIADINKPIESLENWFGSFNERERKKFSRSNKELAAILEAFQPVPKDSLPESQTILSQFQTNLENVRFELEEVLYRMDVAPYEEHLEKLDSKLHKTLDTTPTHNPDEDRNVAKVHKTGFYWREKVFRPEEVTVFRYTSPADEPEMTSSKETVGEEPTDEKGGKTDG